MLRAELTSNSFKQLGRRSIASEIEQWKDILLVLH